MQHRIVKAAIVGTMVAATGCSESAMSPSAPSVQRSIGGMTSPSAALSKNDTLRYSFLLDPRVANSYQLGSGNVVNLPANVVCDPAVTAYGPSEWDKSCKLASAPILMTVSAWLDKDGQPNVDFSPDIRFAPTSSGSAKIVQISMTPDGSSKKAIKDLVIFYCPTRSWCYDESKKDHSLKTEQDKKTGVVTRRLKHFSGYNVAAGEDSLSLPGQERGNPSGAGSSMNRGSTELKLDAGAAAGAATDADSKKKKKRSGYMLVSG